VDSPVIRHSLTLVRLHVASAGSGLQLRFVGSKAMILFAALLLVAEPLLQADRETQKSDIYFTDYTLTG
jgi:hypothetical protein